MKRERSDMLFSLLLLPVDVLMLALSGVAIWYFRFETNILGLPDAYFPVSQLFVALIWIVPVFILSFAVARLYSDHRARGFIDVFFRIVLAVSAGMLSLIVVLFFTQEFETSRFIVIAGWLIATLFVSVGRLVIRQVERISLRRGIGVHHIAIIGESETSRRLKKLFREQPEYGVTVATTLASQDASHIIRELEKYVGSHSISEVIQTDSTLTQEATEQILDFCDEHRLIYKFTPNLFETQATNIGMSTIAGIPIIELKETPLDGWWRVGKRAIDVVGSSAGIIILSPLFLILAAGVKMSSKGPIFYRDPRVDRTREFNLLKFRSMYDNVDHLRGELAHLNERSGPLFKIKNDPRVTKFGNFIRKTSLDETAQLFNVLVGQMSLVGPRPHRPDEISKYKQHHKKLLKIKPGITGLAAISGRSDLDFEEEVRLDTFYIEHWSLLFDLKILLRTVPAVLQSRSAA